MAILRDTRDAIFTIEFPDGRTYTGAAITVEISKELPPCLEPCSLEDDIHAFYKPNMRTWKAELLGVGPLIATTRY